MTCWKLLPIVLLTGLLVLPTAWAAGSISDDNVGVPQGAQQTETQGTNQAAAPAPAQQAEAQPQTAGQASQPLGKPAETPPSAQSEAQQGSSNELPKTASPLPVIGLIGLGSLSAALVVRSVAKRKASAA